MLQLTERNKTFHFNGKYVYHVAVWLILLVIPYLFMSRVKGRINLDLYLLPFTINISLFYINYLGLVPAYLLRKKIPQYILSVLMIFTIIYFLEDFVSQLIISHRFGGPEGIMIPEARSHDIMVPSRFSMPPPPPQGPRVIFSMAISGFFFMTSLALGVHDKWKNYEKYGEKLEREKKLKELELCRKEINPHFLFNAINNIYSLSITDSEVVSDSILKLSSILRYTLYETGGEEVKLKDELEIVDDYIQLQRLRLTDKVKLNYKIISDETEERIEPLIILTLLENAFKYGVDNSEPSFIDILLIVKDGRLSLCTRNKIVRKIGAKVTNSGIGLKNIKNRLEMIYPGKYDYRVNTDNMIYTAYLEIEL